jgi:hypothetical protein
MKLWQFLTPFYVLSVAGMESSSIQGPAAQAAGCYGHYPEVSASPKGTAGLPETQASGCGAAAALAGTLSRPRGSSTAHPECCTHVAGAEAVQTDSEKGGACAGEYTGLHFKAGASVRNLISQSDTLADGRITLVDELTKESSQLCITAGVGD